MGRGAVCAALDVEPERAAAGGVEMELATRDELPRTPWAAGVADAE